jgi:raffinose/stachyose/melibiose transport system permease protein
VKQRQVLSTVLFLVPGLALYTAIKVVPVLFSVGYSLTNWDGLSDAVFVGLRNYARLFANPTYWKVVSNSAVLVGLAFFVMLPLAVIISYLLSKTRRGGLTLRALYFFPMVVSPMAVGLLFFLIYNPSAGPINHILRLIGQEQLIRSWLSDKNVVLYSVSLPYIWQIMGLYVVILVAAFKEIPSSLLESATIDGASAVRTFFSISVPLVAEVLCICMVLVFINTLKAFDLPWAITTGGPGHQSAFLVVFMYKQAFLSSQFGYASAATITVVSYAMVFTVVFRRFSAKFSY